MLSPPQQDGKSSNGADMVVDDASQPVAVSNASDARQRY
jgi:hypothetical protein